MTDIARIKTCADQITAALLAGDLSDLAPLCDTLNHLIARLSPQNDASEIGALRRSCQRNLALLHAAHQGVTQVQHLLQSLAHPPRHRTYDASGRPEILGTPVATLERRA